MSMRYVLLIGSGRVASELIAKLRRRGCKLVGCLVPDLRNETPFRAEAESVADVPVVGAAASDLRDYLAHHAVDVVLLVEPAADPEAIGAWADVTLEVGLDFGLPRGMCDSARLRARATDMSSSFAGLPMLLLHGVRQRRRYLFCKRVFDFAVAAMLLALLAPLLLLIAAVVKAASPRDPIFYRWAVLGKNRKPFVGYKFRTMVANADVLKASLIRFNEMTGPVFKMRHDPRITAVGRVLRKFSLDELPQLYSVLKGDMSLVGPRPPSKSEADHFEFWQHRKLSVKPGITCLWQVSGRSQITDFAEWARLDLTYIRTANFRTDLKILWRTIPAVISGSGAC
jgi:lipopolysaccharide/colanic/teichoic acid biosynthesis glycosyltransferase